VKGLVQREDSLIKPRQSQNRISGFSTESGHDCRFSVSLTLSYNILLLFKRGILYTGIVEYILLCLWLKQKSIKFKQAFRNIQQPRASRYYYKSSSFNFQWKFWLIWRMRNKFPSCFHSTYRWIIHTLTLIYHTRNTCMQ
jgi:hypothetical protein